MVLSDEDDALTRVSDAVSAKLAPEKWRIGVARAVFAGLSSSDLHSVVVATHPFDNFGHFSVGLWPTTQAQTIVEWARASLPRFSENYPWRAMRLGYGPVYTAALPMPTDVATTMRQALASWGAVGCVIAPVILSRELHGEEQMVGFLVVHTTIAEEPFIERHGGFLTRAATLVAEALGSSLAIAREIDVKPRSPVLDSLSAREREVAALVAAGFSDLNIGARLGISEATVGTHLHRTFRKLGVHSRVELARLIER